MLKIVVLGAGSHSQANHLPALARYHSLHPDQVELAALCDLRGDLAVAMAGKYGFARAYTDLDEMLRQEQPDGCIAVTPVSATLDLASRIIGAGVPLLMEKPLGANIAQAREIINMVGVSGARVMVSMNRRFSPALRAARACAGERHIVYLRASIQRHHRAEPTFLWETAIHPLDAMRSVAGDVAEFSAEVRHVGAAAWYVAQLAFETGTLGILEVLPTTGGLVETYDLFGDNYRASAQVVENAPVRVRCWEGDRLALDEEPARDEPAFVRNGAYDETVEFITALRENRQPHPSPAEVLQSVELLHAIAQNCQP
ncbi:MAG: Gfo/Idh/MocA family oxidoreductase [Chloroflexi bacterium]|jgi:predicted dehydrogenase|nr:Gfo/Idh/MocA family oxidoreductase [Chloroflexota bacterium]